MTAAGRELFAVTDRLRTLENIVEEKVASFGALSAGYLRIVANAPRPVMPMISRFSELYPGVRIDFALVGWTLGMRQLKEREIDIALITEPEGVDGLYVRELCATRYRAFVPCDHPLAGRGTISLGDLQAHLLILPEDGSLTQRVVNAKAAEHGLQFPRIFKCQTFPVVKEAVLHGIGVGVILEDSLFPSPGMAALDIEEMPERYSICVATSADKSGLRLVKSFIDLAVDYAETVSRDH